MLMICAVTLYLFPVLPESLAINLSDCPGTNIGMDR